MSSNLSFLSDGKKFMWDGQSYSTTEEASAARETYQSQGFEVRVVEEGGKFHVYTRRVVKAVAATATQ